MDDMTTLSFTAHCAKGHDRVDYTDRAAFEAHMTTEHKARKRFAGTADRESSAGRSVHAGRTAPGWRNGKPEAPTPWKAPPVPRDAEQKLAAVLAKYAETEITYPLYYRGPRWAEELPATDRAA